VVSRINRREKSSLRMRRILVVEKLRETACQDIN
jgi:hypothetical protein